MNAMVYIGETGQQLIAEHKRAAQRADPTNAIACHIRNYTLGQN